MANITVIEGDLVATGGRYALVAARFNEFIVDALVSGAVDTLRRHRVAEQDITLIRVPGAFELPIAVQKAAASGRYDAVIALGAVIRGATPHFDYVAGECTKGLGAAAMQTGIPVIFGVLTVDSIEQALERAGTKAGNKGSEAAVSAIEMVNLLRKIGE